MNPITKTGSSKVWDSKHGDTYLVTGVDREGKRFKLSYHNWMFAKQINVWRGSKWLVRDGKRYLIQSVNN